MIQLKEIEFDKFPVDQKEIIGEDYSGTLFLVMEGKKTIGSVSLLSIQDYCSVDSVFVDPDYRRKGVGTDIAKAILQDYKKIVALSTDEASKAFFQSMDMVYNDELKWWELNRENLL